MPKTPAGIEKGDPYEASSDPFDYVKRAEDAKRGVKEMEDTVSGYKLAVRIYEGKYDDILVDLIAEDIERVERGEMSALLDALDYKVPDDADEEEASIHEAMIAEQPKPYTAADLRGLADQVTEYIQQEAEIQETRGIGFSLSISQSHSPQDAMTLMMHAAEMREPTEALLETVRASIDAFKPTDDWYEECQGQLDPCQEELLARKENLHRLQKAAKIAMSGMSAGSIVTVRKTHPKS